ncbi:hypothetical protein [Amycolatopsis sp. cmx-4-68]|uniref:hypothetical protein n=1 Tax=Amycolatopsis sp. cmx-4-68 TaxID=2790938 RepID=UPI00397B4E63
MELATSFDRLSYVHNLEIAPPHPEIAALAGRSTARAAQVTLDGPTASIDAGSLVSFTASVSPQHRSDALNSTLLAQLNSDKLHDRFDPAQVIDWYRNYTTVLSNIGWDMQAFDLEHYRAEGSTMSVSTAVLGVMAALIPAGELAIVSAALKALSSLKSDDPWYRVWDVSTHDTSRGNFQIGHGTDADGAENTLVLRLSGYSLRTSETTARFLWNNYHTSSTELQFAGQTATLDEDVYSKVRATIVSKLGTRATTYVANLDI